MALASVRGKRRVFHAGHRLLHALETQAPPKDRAAEAAKARARNAERFGVKAPA